MLPKKKRANTKDIRLLFRRGSSVVSPLLNFRFISTKAEATSRVSVIVPKNIAKSAVRRNLLRRRGYTALEKYIDRLPPGTVGALTFKKYEENIPTLANEIKDMFSKVN